MLIVALYYLILNHNPATSVQANILFSGVRIRSDYFFFEETKLCLCFSSEGSQSISTTLVKKAYDVQASWLLWASLPIFSYNRKIFI